MQHELLLPHGNLKLPAFLPDGTQGVVRSVDAIDLYASLIQAIQMNVFHLMQRPGSSTIKALGGLHQMSGWKGPIFTDSGGFQIYSLIRQNPKRGSISERGATFRINGRKFNLTPEKSIRLQLRFGADVIICLDDCTNPDDDRGQQVEAVKRTVDWAYRCRTEYDRLVNENEFSTEKQPKLMAVIQGGRSQELRQRCAQSLLEIGFDAFGYGGWPLDASGNLLIEVLAYTREMVPVDLPLHALGVGHPQNVLLCAQMGYNLFDSTMPTRDARHGRLYKFLIDPARAMLSGEWFTYTYIKDKKHIKVNLPISPYCDCHTCTNYTLGYVHHLYKLGDSLYPRLATIHNLRFMTQLMANLRAQVNNHDG